MHVTEVQCCVLGNADQAKTLADKVHFLLLLHASAVHRYMYTVLYHLDHRSFPHLDASGQYKFDLYQELARLTMFHIHLIKPECRALVYWISQKTHMAIITHISTICSLAISNRLIPNPLPL